MTSSDAPSLRGKLLVANPALPDPNFHRTVVLMLEHSAEGAVGVVLNRPTATDVGDAVPEWGAFAAEPPVLFEGGPVQPQAAICLAEVAGAGATPQWHPVLGEVGTLDLTAHEDDVTPPVSRLRVFAGYAGWGAGQLEHELDLGAWFTVDAGPDDVLSGEPRMLWPRVLKRQGGLLAALASYPDNPRVN